MVGWERRTLWAVDGLGEVVDAAAVVAALAGAAGLVVAAVGVEIDVAHRRSVTDAALEQRPAVGLHHVEEDGVADVQTQRRVHVLETRTGRIQSFSLLLLLLLLLLWFQVWFVGKLMAVVGTGDAG